MLKMLDDYNSKSISEGWKLSTYSTFKEAYGEKAYKKVDKFREGEGATAKNFKKSYNEYDKLYELKNLSRFLYYNGTRYFYFVQGKLDEIAEVETTYSVTFNVNKLYDFIYVINPVELILLSRSNENHRSNIDKKIKMTALVV
jgi:hypothetical protein